MNTYKVMHQLIVSADSSEAQPPESSNITSTTIFSNTIPPNEIEMMNNNLQDHYTSQMRECDSREYEQPYLSLIENHQINAIEKNDDQDTFMFNNYKALEGCLIMPGSSNEFRTKLRNVMREKLPKTIKKHTDVDVNIDVYSLKKKDTKCNEAKDLLSILCNKNIDILNDAVEELLSHIEHIHENNKAIHEYSLSLSPEIDEFPIATRSPKGIRKLYFTYFKMLKTIHDPDMFKQCYKIFEDLIINEMINPNFLSFQVNPEVPQSLLKYYIKKPFTIESQFRKMGFLFQYRSDLLALRMHKFIGTMIHHESRSEDICWSQFYEEERAIIRETAEELFESILTELTTELINTHNSIA